MGIRYARDIVKSRNGNNNSQFPYTVKAGPTGGAASLMMAKQCIHYSTSALEMSFIAYQINCAMRRD